MTRKRILLVLAIGLLAFVCLLYWLGGPQAPRPVELEVDSSGWQT